MGFGERIWGSSRIFVSVHLWCPGWGMLKRGGGGSEFGFIWRFLKQKSLSDPGTDRACNRTMADHFSAAFD